MSAELFCGGHVLCVDARSSSKYARTPLVQGRVYVVTAIIVEPDVGTFIGVADVMGGHAIWHPSRFKPLDEDRLSTLRAIANGMRLPEAA